MSISPDSLRFSCFGTYKFSSLPQALKTSPNSLQLPMDKLTNNLSSKLFLCYFDDIFVVSENFDEHIFDLHEVFDRLLKAGLKFFPQKYKFAQHKCILMGHEVSKDGVF